MSAIFYKNLPYGAGGSNVEANPSGSATGDLTKVGIDGTVYDVTDADAVHSADKGVANGVASLDATGRVPSTQLPSYVDDVLEYASQSAFPATGESGKIYIALDTNKTYRWSGSAYVEISESLALGETTGTAYEGSKGKANADNIASLQTAMNKAYNTDDSAETDLQDTDYIPFYDTSATAKKKSLWSNIKAKLKAYFDTLYDKTPTLATVATSGSYNDLSNKPTIPTVNNKTLTIQKNGTQVAQFTANSASDVTANITVPTGDLASVNKPSSGQTTSYLRGDGTWQNFPSIPAAQVQSDWNQTTTTAVDFIKNKPTIPAAQIQSDWNQTDTTKKDYIKNKPTIPTVPGVVSTSANGLAPKVTNTSNYLKGDGTWSSPANNAVTVTNRTGSSYNNNYPVVFGTNTGTGTVTEGLQKRGGDFTYNPYSEKLSVYQETVESTLKVGVANSSNGYIDIYRYSHGYRGELRLSDDLTADRDYNLPNETGTLATREYLNSNLSWKLLLNDRFVPPTSDTQYTPNVALSSIKEVRIVFIYGLKYRNSMEFSGNDLRSNLLFPDWMFASSRVYCSVATNSSGKLVIGQAGSSGSIGWNLSSGVSMRLFYR